MKKIILFVFSIFFGICLNAQCEDGRYTDSLFTVNVTEGIKFGKNLQTNLLGAEDSVDLLFDLYVPENDEATNRPMLVLAFGGAFVIGTRQDYYMIDMCNHFASLGYVVASIDYRLTSQILNTPTDTLTFQAVAKGTHDMRAAVRYFHKHADSLNIDSEKIYVGGISAGAFAAIHTAYLDKAEEVPPILEDYFAEWGGLEGNSGNPEYSSAVAGVINLSGAIGDTSWIEPNDVPIVSMHGTADTIVPYAFGLIEIFDINAEVFGSADIHVRANNLGLNNDFYTYVDEGHTPFINVLPFFPNENYIENYAVTLSFVGGFMGDLQCDVISNNNYLANSNSVKIFPNPATNYIQINTEYNDVFTYQLVDLTGKLCQQGTVNNKSIQLTNNYNAGLYLLELTGTTGNFISKKVMIH